MHAHEQGGEADKGGCRGAGIGALGARHVGEHVVVRALEGDAPLFVVAEFFSVIYYIAQGFISIPTIPNGDVASLGRHFPHPGAASFVEE